VKYQIRHLTRYRYAESVAYSQHDLHLLLRDLPQQHCLSTALEFIPSPSVCQERVDYFGNRATHVGVAVVHNEFVVTAQSRVEVLSSGGLAAESDLAWEAVAAEIVQPRGDLHIQEMSFASPFVALWQELRTYALPSFPVGQPMLKGCLELMACLFRDFTYDPRATSIATPLAEVFQKRRGVCQDFSHLMIACLRSLGLSARYVSGYLVTSPPAGQPRLLGADASHAWLSVFSRASVSWISTRPTTPSWATGTSPWPSVATLAT